MHYISNEFTQKANGMNQFLYKEVIYTFTGFSYDSDTESPNLLKAVLKQYCNMN